MFHSLFFFLFNKKNIFIAITVISICFFSCNEKEKQFKDDINELNWINSVLGYSSIQTGISYNVNGISTTSDSGFVFVAYVYSEETLFDALIIKVNNNGNVEWANTYGGKNFDTDIIYDVATLPCGGYICAGKTYSPNIEGFKTGAKVTWNSNGWMLKLDHSGNIVWQKAFGGYDYDKFSSVVFMPSGYILAAGETRSNINEDKMNMGRTDNWILLCDTAGQVMYELNYGSRGIDRIYDIAVFNDSLVLLMGGTNFINSEITPNYNVSLAMINIMNGEILWEEQWGGDAWDIGNAVAIDNDKRIVVVGQTESNNLSQLCYGMNDAFIAVFDSLGTNLWAKNFGGSLNDYFNDISIVGDKYVAIGTTLSFDYDVSEKAYKINCLYRNADAIIVIFSSCGAVYKKHILSGTDQNNGKGVAAKNNNKFSIAS